MPGGVCSGIARYFDVDTTLARVAFAVLTIAGGSGPLAYPVLWAVVDAAPPKIESAPVREIVLTEEPGPIEGPTENERSDADPEETMAMPPQS